MEPYVFHSRPNSTGVRVTVVGQNVNGELKLAASRCSEKDAFVKSIGRFKATERLSVDNLIATIDFQKPSLNRFIGAADAVAEHVIKNGLKPVKLTEKKVLFSTSM